MASLIPFTKRFESSENLVDLLESRGLQICDRNKAIQYLDNIGYYRLSAYMYPLLKMPKTAHLYKEGSTFKKVMMLYRFDKKLRLLMFNEIEKIETIPSLMPIGKPQVLLGNGMEDEIIEYVPFERLKAVGYNKWKKNFVYAAIGPDNLLYLAFCNPQAQYLKQLKFRGIFEDYEKALELECEDKNKVCDIMERDFPLEVMLIPDLIARVVKDALGIQYRPADRENNAADDLATIATFVKNNMKSNLQKQIEGE